MREGSEGTERRAQRQVGIMMRGGGLHLAALVLCVAGGELVKLRPDIQVLLVLLLQARIQRLNSSRQVLNKNNDNTVTIKILNREQRT